MQIPYNPVAAYLIYSYAYYVCNLTLIPDTEYDAICFDLLKRYDEIDHPHKHLLDRDALKAGTAYHLGQLDYPLRVQVIGNYLREDPQYLEKLHRKWKDKPLPEPEPEPQFVDSSSSSCKMKQGSLLEF